MENARNTAFSGQLKYNDKTFMPPPTPFCVLVCLFRLFAVPQNFHNNTQRTHPMNVQEKCFKHNCCNLMRIVYHLQKAKKKQARRVHASYEVISSSTTTNFCK